MITCRKLRVLILSLMILPAFIAVNVTALSEENNSIGDLPDLPLILHGDIDVNGEPVSAGSEIMAYYEGELIAKSTVREDGEYSLNLNLTPENYTNIGSVEFYINGDKAIFEMPASQMEAIKDKTPGSITEVDIGCSASSSDRDTNSGSSSSEGEARVVNKDTAKSAPEEAEGSSGADFAGENEDDIVDAEGPVSQVDDEEDIEGVEDVEGAEDAEDAGYSTVFTALLFVAALFGAFMVIKR